MALVPARCTQCGASLQVENDCATATCEYCRTTFKLEDAAICGKKNTKGLEIVDGVLKRYTGSEANVVIPNGVVTIGNNAFYQNKTVVSVEIPNTVKSIGTPSGWLGASPFEGCKNLRKVNIPDNVEFIKKSSFSFTKNLTEVDISFEKLSSFSKEDIERIFVTGSIRKHLIKRLKEESKQHGVCWQCKKPLNLRKSGMCIYCGYKTDISPSIH
jgi:Zn finger protein HypA/HybF involved in hydrogenase expression